MNTREIAADYRQAHWAEVMRERAERGVSIRLYCEQAGFHENTYYYWQRKLREAACSGIQTKAITEGKSVVPTGWMALNAKEASPQAQGLTVEVNGYRINVLADTDPMLLVKVCRALKAL